MDRRNLLKALAGLAVCPVCTTTGFAAEGAHWSYEGAGGPAKWGDLDAANKACSLGSQQSPIDIGPTIKSQLPALKLSWGKTADTIVNNGHTIQLNFAEGSTLKLGDTTYKLLQVHFHRPSEHLIGGKSFPMEAHFVHRADSGGLAVVGVMFSEGKPNATFGKIVATMPAKEGPAVKADAAINPNGLLAGEARLLPVSGLADDTALLGSRRMAGADRSDPGRGQRCRRLRETLSDECPPGAAGQPPLRAAVELITSLSHKVLGSEFPRDGR